MAQRDEDAREAAMPGSDTAYDEFADKIGMVPNARRSDNLLQARIFALVWLICLGLGGFWGAVTNPGGFGPGLLNGALTGGLLGLIVALLVSGAVVGFRGLTR